MQRFKSHEVKEVIGFLNKHVYPDVQKRVTRQLERIEVKGPNPGAATLKRLQSMEIQVGEVLGNGYSDARRLLVGDLDALAKTQATWQAEQLKSVSIERLKPVLPTALQLRTIVRNRPFEGRLLKEWWKDLSVKAKTGVMSQVRLGMVQGESNEAIVRRVIGTRARGYEDGIIGLERRNATTIVRTAVQHTSNAARDLLYEENDDLVKGVQWVATLDVTTCIECGGLDGRVFNLRDGPRPPAHMRCRCTTVPVMRSWKELGIKAKEITGEQRNSMDGMVPAKTTYAQWIKNAPPKIQNEALGLKRAELLRSNKKVDITQFVDRTGRTLSLDQIGKFESAAFSEAPIATFKSVTFQPKLVKSAIKKKTAPKPKPAIADDFAKEKAKTEAIAKELEELKKATEAEKLASQAKFLKQIEEEKLKAAAAKKANAKFERELAEQIAKAEAETERRVARSVAEQARRAEAAPRTLKQTVPMPRRAFDKHKSEVFQEDNIITQLQRKGHSKAQAEKLYSQLDEAIDVWKGDSAEIRAFQRGQILPTHPDYAELKAHVKAIENTLDLAPGWKGSTLYRGESFADDIKFRGGARIAQVPNPRTKEQNRQWLLDYLESGRTDWKWRSHTGFSSEPGVAEQFSGHVNPGIMFEIRLKPGRASRARSIENIGFNEEEFELLVPKDTQFRILNWFKEPKTKSGGQRIRIILEEVENT